MKSVFLCLFSLFPLALVSFAGTPASPPATPVFSADPCADVISYDNIELLYVHTDSATRFPGDRQGIALNGEYPPFENVFITGGVSYLEDDYVDGWNLSAGIGGFLPLTANVHAVVDGGILWSETGDVPIGATVARLPDDDFGWYVRPHLRARWGCLTVHAGVIYRDIFEDEEWQGFASAYYQVAPNWDITAGCRFGEDDDTITAGIRYHF